jgi:hypothetical protein
VTRVGTRTSKVGRNDPCTCGSGVKWKKCCGDPAKLQVYLYDHRKLRDVWDVSALDAEHATRSFRARWEELLAAGQLPEAAVEAGFEAGRVFLEREAS